MGSKLEVDSQLPKCNHRPTPAACWLACGHLRDLPRGEITSTNISIWFAAKDRRCLWRAFSPRPFRGRCVRRAGPRGARLTAAGVPPRRPAQWLPTRNDPSVTVHVSPGHLSLSGETNPIIAAIRFAAPPTLRSGFANCRRRMICAGQEANHPFVTAAPCPPAAVQAGERRSR